MAYLLDSNILIDAKNFYYGFDLCPGYWEWVNAAHSDGTLITINQVQSELLAKEDELSEWVKQCPSEYFAEVTDECANALAEVSSWVQGHGYKPSAVQGFFNKADYFLVAYAKAHGHTVMSREVHSAGRSKVKIPTVCSALNIPYVNAFDLLKNLGVSFHLK